MFKKVKLINKYVEILEKFDAFYNEKVSPYVIKAKAFLETVKEVLAKKEEK